MEPVLPLRIRKQCDKNVLQYSDQRKRWIMATADDDPILQEARQLPAEAQRPLETCDAHVDRVPGLLAEQW